MKLYNFLFFIVMMHFGMIWASGEPLTEPHPIARIPSCENLHQAMIGMPSTAQRLQNLNNRHHALQGFQHVDNYISQPPGFNSNNFYNPIYYQQFSEESHVTDRYNQIVIDRGTSEIYTDMRQRRPKQVCSGTKVALVLISTFGLIELGFDIVNLYGYYNSPHDPQVKPEFLIARVANSTLRVGLLYWLYKLNQEKLH